MTHLHASLLLILDLVSLRSDLMDGRSRMGITSNANETVMLSTCVLKALVVVTVQRKDVLLPVNVLEEEIEDYGADESSDRWSTKIPGQQGVSDDRGASKADGVCDSSVEQVQRGNQSSHVYWCTRICNAISWDVDEKLRDTTDSIWDGDEPNGDWSDERVSISINTGRASAEVTTWTELVCVVVDDGVANSADGGQEETEGDAGDGAEVDAAGSQ